MSNFQGPAMVAGQAIFSSSSVQYHELGEKHVTSNGREFRYCRAGAVALVAGNVIQAPAQVVNHDNLTPVAAAVGATQVSIALGATLATANQYAGGLVVVDTTPGEGYSYRIGGHLAIASSGTGIFTLLDEIQVAWTTSTRVTLVPNPYRGVIQSPVTTLTGSVVGVAVFPIAIAEYGWVATHGPTGVLVAGTPGVGLAVVVPATAAGAVVIDGAATATQVVGSMMVTGIDGLIQPVYLTID